MYNNLTNDELTEYGEYKSSFLLDTAASGNYGDLRTKAKKKRRIKTGKGILVGCANGNLMSQVAAAEVPFDKIPSGAKDMQLFEHMHTPLLSGGKLVENDCNIMFDKPHATVLQGATKERIRNIIAEAEEEAPDDIVMTVPFDANTLTWRTGTDDALQVKGRACNVH